MHLLPSPCLQTCSILTQNSSMKGGLCDRQVLFATINVHQLPHLPRVALPHPRPNIEAPPECRSRKLEWSKIRERRVTLDSSLFSSPLAWGLLSNEQRRPISPDPLPKSTYNVLKNMHLQKVLANQGFPVTGGSQHPNRTASKVGSFSFKQGVYVGTILTMVRSEMGHDIR
jgi:hypothetical protein